jgi:hypothetical protein
MKTTILACLAVAAVAMGQVKLQEDEPLIHPPRSGAIHGTVSPADSVAEVYASNRNNFKTYPGEYNKATGQFTVKDLPGDSTYDIGVKLKDGRAIEGIDLSALDSRMLRLAEIRRKALGRPPEEQHVFDQEDANALLQFAEDLKSNDFMDRGRVLYLAGHGRRATMLVELMRTREFYDQKNTGQGAQLIWRIEMWYYEYEHGGWERVANQERVLRRERIPSGQWSKISLEFLPQWSVYLDPDAKSEAASLKIPDKADPTTGRPAGTEPNLKTKPHILGMKAAQTPTTAPSEKPEE